MCKVPLELELLRRVSVALRSSSVLPGHSHRFCQGYATHEQPVMWWLDRMRSSGCSLQDEAQEGRILESQLVTNFRWCESTLNQSENDLNETSSDGELNKSSAADGELNQTPAADGEINDTSAADQVGGANQEKEAEEEKGGGPLSGLIDQAKYISKSLDGTLATLLKLEGNIQDANTQIKQNQETSAKAIEGLNKIKSDIASFNSQFKSMKDKSKKVGNTAYSVDIMAAGSKIQAEEQAKEDPVETPA